MTRKRKFFARATPTAKGKDAEKIQWEIRYGTPDTPERIETIRRADELFRRLNPSRKDRIKELEAENSRLFAENHRLRNPKLP